MVTAWMIQRRHMLCTWWLSNIKRKLQNFIDSCLYSLSSGLHYLLQLNLSNFKLPIKKFQMHHAPGCLKLKITLHVYQVLFCNFYSVVLSTLVSAANPFPYVHHNRRKNKQDSLIQLIPNHSILFQQWLLSWVSSDICSQEGGKGESGRVSMLSLAKKAAAPEQELEKAELVP